jgi:glutathione S-transferase
MMRLLSAPTSPYGRKVKIAAHMKGVMDQIKVEFVDTTDPKNVRELQGENPLVKIPVLITSDGSQLFDSHVICEYLDTLSPKARLFPDIGAARFNTLTLGALGDGIMDAALLLVYERRFRPEDKWVQSWVDRQQAKVDSAMQHLERNPPSFGQTPDYGHVTIASALGYLDLRQDGRWRKTSPNLVAWLERFQAAVPAYAVTTPPK